jgi:predicted nucleic acid-binding Zn ribbon protein
MEARGFGRQKGRRELEAAWVAAAGESLSGRSRVTGLRRGVLRITVAHSALLEELAGYRKSDLLRAVQKAAPNLGVKDLRFQVGSLD